MPGLSSSRQLFEQRLRVLQVRRVESLGEPPVDLCKHLARFALLALLLQKTTQARHYSEFERLRALPARDVDCVAKASLGFGGFLGLEQQLSLEAAYLRLPVAFPASFHRGKRFGHESECI